VASGPVREKPESLYRQVIAPRASKIVWYDFRGKLPDVSPAETATASKRPRAEFKMPQEITAGSADAPRARQFVWLPAPRLELKQDLQSPNLLAFRAPHVEPPKPKLFVPPPEAPKPVAQAPALAPPPQLPKQFQAPEMKKAAAAAPLVEAPPEIQLARNLSGAGVAGSVLGVRPAQPQPRAFVAPRAGQAGTGSTPVLPAAPSVQVAANVGAGGEASPIPGGELAKPARRTFEPPVGGARPSPFGAPLADAPALTVPVSAADVSVVIVGLNPSPAAPAPSPEGSRNAQFSSGPNQRIDGGSGGGVDGATLVIPGLRIHGDPQDSKPVMVARNAPTSQGNLREALRGSVPAPPVAGEHPQAVRAATVPEPLLQGRVIYAMTVQMPNITSHSGSWMIWFAERRQEFSQRGEVSAPVPLRKVDPKYIASAISDRVEGKVRLAAVIRKDGRVDSVKLLRHLDDRLDQSAAEAIDKWRFEPALRNGAPVDVDAVIEIPFALAPRVAQ
jgi:TonB family protein